MTFIGIKATAIQAIFEYTRKKATPLFLEYTRRKATLFLNIQYLHPLFTAILSLPLQFDPLPKPQ